MGEESLDAEKLDFKHSQTFLENLKRQKELDKHGENQKRKDDVQTSLDAATAKSEIDEQPEASILKQNNDCAKQHWDDPE